MTTTHSAKRCFEVAGPSAALRGEVRVPGDKSIGHRAVMFSAIAVGGARVTGLSGGEDNRRTVDAFRALGVRIAEVSEDGRALDIEGVGLDGLRPPEAALDCGNSGTTMRLLSGVLAPSAFAVTLVGDQYLHARPMARVARPLRAMGARVEGRDGASLGRKAGEIYPPLIVGGGAGPLRGIEYVSPVTSAQVKSAVLLAALRAEGRTRFVEATTTRDHTERMLAAMGAPVSGDAGGVIVDPAGWDRRLIARDVYVPGDLSAAAFLIGAALLVPGSEVLVRGVGANPTRTGLLDALAAMGADLTLENARLEGGEPVADLRARATRLRGTRIEGALAVRAIDEIPLLCALAAHADGVTVIAGAEELRVKESDRIAAMAAALTAFGVAVEERPDGMIIHGQSGRPLRGAVVDSHGDHRIAMASAVCALPGGERTRIDDVDNVATSFPSFLSTLSGLGAPIAEG